MGAEQSRNEASEVVTVNSEAPVCDQVRLKRYVNPVVIILPLCSTEIVIS